MDTKDLLWHLMQGWEATVGLEACPRLRFGVGPTHPPWWSDSPSVVGRLPPTLWMHPRSKAKHPIVSRYLKAVYYLFSDWSVGEPQGSQNSVYNILIKKGIDNQFDCRSCTLALCSLLFALHLAVYSTNNFFGLSFHFVSISNTRVSCRCIWPFCMALVNSNKKLGIRSVTFPVSPQMCCKCYDIFSLL